MVTFKAAEKTGREPILDEISYESREIGRLEGEIAARNRRIERLEALLRYCECPKCGAELSGGIRAAEEIAEACKLVGRTDEPCAFCDSPKQTAAMEKALEVLA